ncbi:MAG: hypothetical protein ABIR47_01010 [Candidatus Kapaibacterium sp.]
MAESGRFMSESGRFMSEPGLIRDKMIGLVMGLSLADERYINCRGRIARNVRDEEALSPGIEGQMVIET